MVQQRLLEQAVEDGVRRTRGQRQGNAGELGVAGQDTPDHLLAALVDFQHVGAEGLLEQALVAQVVPEPVHRRVGPQRLRHRLAELPLEFPGRPRGGDDLVVAGDAGGLVLAHAVRDQVLLVAEVVVQHAVREGGLLRDLAQAGPGVAEFRERLESGVGQLGPPFGELVDLAARDPLPVRLSHTSPVRYASSTGYFGHIGHNNYPVGSGSARTLRVRPLYLGQPAAQKKGLTTVQETLDDRQEIVAV
jgi:hypothetical protein